MFLLCSLAVHFKTKSRKQHNLFKTDKQNETNPKTYTMLKCHPSCTAVTEEQYIFHCSLHLGLNWATVITKQTSM